MDVSPLDAERAAALADLEDLRRRVRWARSAVRGAITGAETGIEIPWSGRASEAWRGELISLVLWLRRIEARLETIQGSVTRVERELREVRGE